MIQQSHHHQQQMNLSGKLEDFLGNLSNLFCSQSLIRSCPLWGKVLPTICCIPTNPIHVLFIICCMSTSPAYILLIICYLAIHEGVNVSTYCDVLTLVMRQIISGFWILCSIYWLCVRRNYNCLLQSQSYCNHTAFILHRLTSCIHLGS
jgi:hypothetical protein